MVITTKVIRRTGSNCRRLPGRSYRVGSYRVGCGHVVKRTLGPSGIPETKFARLKAPAPTSNSSPNLKLTATGNSTAIVVGFGPGKRPQHTCHCHGLRPGQAASTWQLCPCAGPRSAQWASTEQHGHRSGLRSVRACPKPETEQDLDGARSLKSCGRAL